WRHDALGIRLGRRVGRVVIGTVVIVVRVAPPVPGAEGERPTPPEARARAAEEHVVVPPAVPIAAAVPGAAAVPIAAAMPIASAMAAGHVSASRMPAHVAR